MRDVSVGPEMIRLGQFLKLSGAVDIGSEAKRMLAESLVSVNGEVEVRRGRQLALGDVVLVAGETLRVAP